MSASSQRGVLLTAFGGPDCIESVGPFMTALMHREPSADMLARARAKYEAIGGCSPLTPIAQEIATALERELAEHGTPVPVRVGMRYWDPYIEDAMRELAAGGCTHVVMTSLSPFESKVACGAYREAAAEAVEEIEITGVCETPSLHTAPQFRAFFADACRAALDSVEAQRPLVIMTAHSLPESDLVEGDPYVAGLREVSAEVAEAAGLGPGRDIEAGQVLDGIAAFGGEQSGVPWLLAYQSKGMRPGVWLGPDLGDVFVAAGAADHDAVVVCPVGFATDHMETLYDLDIVARSEAEAAGLTFVRGDVPNAAPELIEAFADLVRPMLVGASE
jgi:ferrochelatase